MIGGVEVFVHLSEGFAILGDAATVSFFGEVDAVEKADEVIPYERVWAQDMVLDEGLYRGARYG